MEAVLPTPSALPKPSGKGGAASRLLLPTSLPEAAAFDRLLVLAMLAAVVLSAAGIAFELAEWTGIGGPGRWDPSHTTHVAVAVTAVVIGASALVWSRKLREEAASRARAEARALAAGERHQRLVNSLDGIVWEADPRTFQVSFVSPQFERFLGYPAGEWLSGRLTWKDLLPPEDYDRVIETCVREIAAGRNHTLDYRMVAADGRTVWFRDVTTVINEGGRPVKLLGILVDITESKQLQDQLHQAQKLEAVGQLAGGVAHELNNPLQAIMAYSTLLERKIEAVSGRVPEAEQCRKTVSALREATERSAKIVKGLLSFARKDGVSMTTVDLNDLARSTAEFLGHTLGLQEVRVELDLGPGPLPVRGNPVALQQALTNLLLNAKDAMPGGGTVTLRTRRENDSVEIAVADAGAGMGPEVRARLFEPFFTTKPPGKGTGLGLSIACGIVKEHGGSIEVQSGAGRGSTFTLRFPPMAAPEPPGVPGAAEAQS